MYLFGQDFTYHFYPQLDADDVASIPTQTPAIYLFSVQPSETQAASGSGAIQTITSWTELSPGYSFQIDAIDDPSPASADDREVYWLAINFVLSTGEQTQTVLHALDMRRVRAQPRRLDVTPSDLKNMLPAIEKYRSDAQLVTYVSLASSQIKTRLKNAGFEWGNLRRPDELRQAVELRALALAVLGERQEEGDKFDRWYQDFSAAYEAFMSSIEVEYSASGKGDDARPESVSSYAVVVR